VHFPPNDPEGGAEAFRTFVLEITANGTRLTTLSSAGLPLAVTPFNVLNSNLALAAFGESFTVALFQQRSDDSWDPENTFGDFDSVKVEIETEEAPPLQITVADLAGSSVQLSILQAADANGATEALLDHLTVTSTTTGVLFDDAFDPGAGPGDQWVAATGNGAANQFQSGRSVNDNRWHHVALVYDQAATGAAELFIDGMSDTAQPNAAAWAWGATQTIELGRSHDPYWRTFDGVLDDVRW